MAALDSFFSKIIARIGLRADLKSTTIEQGEIVLTTDDNTFNVGDGSSSPPKIPTTKASGDFDFSSADTWKLPGNILFDKTKPGQVNGVDLASLNAANGIIVRTGDNKFASAVVTSTDSSLVVDDGSGANGNIDLGLNLNNKALLDLINSGGYVLYVGSNPPNNPISGADYFDSDDDILYKRIGDASTGAWVDYSS